MYNTPTLARLDAFNFDLLALEHKWHPFSMDTPGKPLAEMSADDFSNDTNTTGVVNIGGSTTGVFEIAGDEDWFAVSLSAGEYFEFDYSILDGFMGGSLFDSTGTAVNGADGFAGLDKEFIGYDIVTSGTYYVSMTDFDGSTDRPYSFAANIYTVDDHGDDISTTSLLTNDGDTTGTLEFVNDRDWFEVSLVAGEQFTVNGNTIMDELNVSLRDASGNFVATSSAGMDAGFTYLVETSGTYYVSVASGFLFPTPGMNYTLTATTSEADLPGDTTTMGTIALGGTAESVFETEDDTDWFAFSLTGSQIVNFSMSEFTREIAIYDEFGSSISGRFNTESYVFSGDAGNYFVGVTSDFGQTGAYTLTATEIIDDYAGDISTTGSVTIDGSTTGNFEFENDSDWFAFTLAGDQIVTFSVSLPPRDIVVYDSSGNFVNSTSFTDSYTFFGSAGNYFVELASGPSQTGAYTLTATEIIDDYTADISTMGAIAINGSTTGSFDFDNDADWFAFTLTGDQIVTFSLSSFSQDISIYDTSGNLVNGKAFTDNYTFLGNAGNYFVGVTADFGQYGRYTLTATEIIDDYAGNLSTLGVIAVGDVIRGSIDFESDQDWFAFTGSAGQSISIRQDAVTMNDPFLRLLDSAGNELASNDDFNGLSSQIDYTFTANGTYYISAQPLGSLDIGTYDLSVMSVINGTPNDDVLTGTNDDDDIFAFAGDDIVSALGGNDDIFGGDGNDTLRSGSGDDSAEGGTGDDTILGNAGDDNLSGGADNDLIIGGGGNDTVNGDDGNDSLSGQGGNDVINGNLGDDTVLGGAGMDTISGGEGIDDINAGGGNDTVNGDAGDDLINGGSGADTMFGGDGDDNLSGNNQNDSIFGEFGVDTISGGAGNDWLDGGEGNDILSGDGSKDTIFGGSGDDTLFGNSGGDTLDGGDGADTLEGGGGNDILAGGAGADIFVQSSGFRTDRITDFEDGVDLIDFSGNSTVNDFAKVMNSASQVGNTVRIELNPNNILVLENFDIADLDATDFIF